MQALELIRKIAEDYADLSPDNIRRQRDEFQNLCREFLENSKNPELVTLDEVTGVLNRQFVMQIGTHASAHNSAVKKCIQAVQSLTHEKSR